MTRSGMMLRRLSQCRKRRSITTSTIVINVGAICLVYFGLFPHQLHAQEQPTPVLVVTAAPASDKNLLPELAQGVLINSVNDNSSINNRIDKKSSFMRVSLGIGLGGSDITPDEQGIYINDSGLALAIGLSVEKPIAPILSVQAGFDTLIVNHANLFEDSTTSLGMFLSTGLSLGRRDVPGNFHVSGSVGYGFAGIGGSEDEDNTCLTVLCGDTDKGGTGLGGAYRLSIGYTASNSTLFELVTQRVGGEGNDFPNGTQGVLSSYMIMVTSGIQ